MIPKEDVETLSSFGLSTLQAKVYLAIVRLDEANVQNISGSLHVARQHIYAIVHELEEIGLVERILNKPIKLNGAPIKEAVSILLERKYREKSEAEKKALNLIERYEHGAKTRTTRDEGNNTFLLIPKRKALSLRLKKSIDSVQKSIDIWVPKKTCLQAFFSLAPSYAKALERGVKIRCIVDEQIHVKAISESVRKIIKNPGFKYKIISTQCMETFGLYDGEFAIVSSDTRQECCRAPALFSNSHPLVRIIQHYFDCMWNETAPLDPPL